MSDYVNATGTLNGERIGYTEEELADFVQGYYKEGFASNYGAYAEYGYKDGDILTFPVVKSTEVLYYNKDALYAAGLTVPTTWDELWAACETLN
jgi:ABC-type glycerol-3-phosphate transport system substrate-binding protein